MTTYQEAGVDIAAGHSLVAWLKQRCPDIGGFGGLYPLGDHYLVGAADGVGTKLRLAVETGQHSTIGIDLVAMCVNDLLCCGARPLFFLDYLAMSSLDLSTAKQVLEGILEGCHEAECQLLGGETAEMPGFYRNGEYDLSGFAVGLVEKGLVVDGRSIAVGDDLVGLPSTGVHSNGFSLVRKALVNSDLDTKLAGVPIRQLLLKPTAIYVRSVVKLLDEKLLTGVAHITGGGLLENVGRLLPKGCRAEIDRTSWNQPALFSFLQQRGGIPEEEMWNVFNMGIGMVVSCPPRHTKRIIDRVEGALQIGTIVEGDGTGWTQ